MTTSERRDGPPVAAPRLGRAGRDLPAAIAVGAGLLLGLAASLLLAKTVFVLVVLVAIGYAVWELKTALAARGVAVPVWPVLAGGAAILLGTYFGGIQSMAGAAALTVLAVALARMPGGPAGYVRDVTAGVFTALYLPFLAAFVLLLLRPDDGTWRVLAFILVVAASDVGGYVTGALFGRHPMAPTISPKKSWEGFAGSLLGSVLVGATTVTLLLDGRWWVGVLLGLVAAIAATFGDLVESMLKRDLGLKDMGTLLPGHGGLLDRLDSLLATVPFAWLLLHWLV